MWIEIIRISWRSIRSNKMRSFLTMLGIIIGVLAVILSSAIGLGAKDNVTKRVERLGSNVLTVIPGASHFGGIARGAGSSSSLTLKDVRAIQQQDTEIAAVAPLVMSSEQVVAGPNNTNTRIEGTTPAYFRIKNINIAQGHFFTQSDVARADNVAVLGSSVATTLFSGTTNPVGQTIDIKRIPFTVVGVAQKQGGNGFNNPDNAIAIPATTASDLLTGSDKVNHIVASAKSPTVMDEAQLQIDSTLRVTHKLAANVPDNFRIINQATILSALSGVSQILTDLLDGISAISLLVGGIGIMNIMLVSVTERTREIGIRKAIGAKKSLISTQFLLEALILSLAGAVIGLIVGSAGAIIASHLMKTGNLLSGWAVGLSILFSVAIGIIFGVYPARKAANLKPIDALRFE